MLLHIQQETRLRKLQIRVWRTAWNKDCIGCEVQPGLNTFIGCAPFFLGIERPVNPFAATFVFIITADKMKKHNIAAFWTGVNWPND